MGTLPCRKAAVSGAAKTTSHRFKQLTSALLTVVIMLTLLPVSVYAASKIQVKNDPDRTTLYSGHSYTIEYVGTQTVKFSSDDKTVLKIGSTNGKVTLVGPGTVKVTAKDSSSGKTVSTRTFTVKWRADSVSVPQSSIVLHPGNTYQLTPTMTPSNSTDALDYSSSDSSVAKVSGSGVITGVSQGSCTVTVYAKALSSTAISSTANKTTQVNVTVEPHNISLWTDNRDNATHSGTCDDCGSIVTEKHIDRDGNERCDVCDAAVGLTDIVTVEITWGEMAFTYQSAQWNTETLRWESVGWLPDTEGGNRITVENKGNIPVSVTYKYTQIDTTVYGSFSDGSRSITAPVTVAVGETKYAYLLLSGEFTRGIDTDLGTVTVRIGGA